MAVSTAATAVFRRAKAGHTRAVEQHGKWLTGRHGNPLNGCRGTVVTQRPAAPDVAGHRYGARSDSPDELDARRPRGGLDERCARENKVATYNPTEMREHKGRRCMGQSYKTQPEGTRSVDIQRERDRDHAFDDQEHSDRNKNLGQETRYCSKATTATGILGEMHELLYLAEALWTAVPVSCGVVRKLPMPIYQECSNVYQGW
ncbi:hypothetical protein FB451DRAFT_1171682 [Mycena latifolia]|nr:hypothetical protein FB451DRAFT_1171682 [Mycena latifolia]